MTAVRKRGSSPTNSCTVMSRPSSAPRAATRRLQPGASRSGELASRITHHTIGGSSHCAVMCRCELACDMVPGANAQNAPPIAAAAQCRRTVRANSRYQATAVPARLRNVATAKLTDAPNARVTGVSRSPMTRTDVLPIRLTPSGAFSRWLTRSRSPVKKRVATASIHSISAWSLALSASAPVVGLVSSPLTRMAAATTRPAHTATSTGNRRRWDEAVGGLADWPVVSAVSGTSASPAVRGALVTRRTLTRTGKPVCTPSPTRYRERSCATPGPGGGTADTAALKAAAARRAGSTPAPGTCRGNLGELT